MELVLCGAEAEEVLCYLGALRYKAVLLTAAPTTFYGQFTTLGGYKKIMIPLFPQTFTILEEKIAGAHR